MGDEIFYTDKRGGRDHECVSLGCNHERVLAGRTPIQVYRDFVAEFADHCRRENLWGAVRCPETQASCVSGFPGQQAHHEQLYAMSQKRK